MSDPREREAFSGGPVFSVAQLAEQTAWLTGHSAIAEIATFAAPSLALTAAAAIGAQQHNAVISAIERMNEEQTRWQSPVIAEIERLNAMRAQAAACSQDLFSGGLPVARGHPLFERQPRHGRFQEWHVQELPDSPLVVVRRRGGGVVDRRRWATLAGNSLDDLQLTFFRLTERELPGKAPGEPPSAAIFAREYWLTPKTITRRLQELGVQGWRAFVKLCGL